MGGQAENGVLKEQATPGGCLDFRSREHSQLTQNSAGGCFPLARTPWEGRLGEDPGVWEARAGRCGSRQACPGRSAPSLPTWRHDLPPQHTGKPPFPPHEGSQRASAVPPPEPAPMVSLGDRVSRMLSSQGRMLRCGWSSSLSPSGLASPAAMPGEGCSLPCSQGASRTSDSAEDALRHRGGLSQMPAKGTETNLSGNFGRRGHYSPTYTCPPN